MIGPVTITLPDRTQVQTVGEIITEHFAVTALIDPAGEFTGDFVATHTPSGAALGRTGVCVAHARALARLLAAQPVDWSRTFDDLNGDADLLSEMSQIVSMIADDCDPWAGCYGLSTEVRQRLTEAQAVGALLDEPSYAEIARIKRNEDV